MVTDSGSEAPPETDDPPVSEFLFGVISTRLAAQLDRIDKIDTKIGAVIAAIIAAIGFALSSDKTLPDYWVTLLLLIPLGFAVYAFRTKAWDDAPNPRYFSDNFQVYPEASKRAAITRMVQAYEKNEKDIEKKGKHTNVGLFAAIIITILLMILHVREAYASPEVQIGSGKVGQQTIAPAIPATGTPTIEGRPTTRPALTTPSTSKP